MSRNSTFYTFFALVVFSVAFASCRKFEGSQTVPAYIHIDSITVNCDYFVYGANTSKVTDAWVYIDDDPIGCFELPATFPVLEKGLHKVSVYAGICVDGRSSARDRYPFYKPAVYEKLALVEDSIINLNPVVNYYPIGEGVEKGWMEDFENANTLLPTPQSDTGITRVTGAEAWHSINSFWSGKVELPPDSLDFTFATADEFTFHSQLKGNYCLLEMDYNCNDTFFVGVMYYKDYRLVSWPLVKVTPTDKEHDVPSRWNKIYINLGYFLTEIETASYFKLYFTSDLTVDSVYEEYPYSPLDERRYYYFDNMKLLYRPS